MTEHPGETRPRIPPNQVVTGKFPVMTAGTPKTAGKEDWTLTLDGDVFQERDEAAEGMGDQRLAFFRRGGARIARDALRVDGEPAGGAEIQNIAMMNVAMQHRDIAWSSQEFPCGCCAVFKDTAVHRCRVP